MKIKLLVVLLVVLMASIVNAGMYTDQIPVPFSQIVWDHTNVSGWPITSKLSSVYISGSLLWMPFDKSCKWPPLDGVVNANSWVIHKRLEDETWHANTWDFMRVCQISKHSEAVGAPDGWRPTEGEEIYIFMSGIARPGYPQTIQERSNIIKYYWHGEKGLPPDPCENNTEPPILSSFIATPMTVLYTNNKVSLSWSADNADTFKLEASTGESGESSIHDAIIGGVELFVYEDTTYTLTARNECSDETTWPSMTVSVKMISPMTGVYMLLFEEQ